MQNLTVGIDIGGTKVAGGLVTPKGRLIKAAVAPTRAKEGVEKSFGQVRRLIERLIRQAGGKHNIIGIGLCCPG
ncbi:MAG: ROK family protein, partial [Terriglobia bacterium]